MKHYREKNSLDQKIDALLAAQPIQANENFTQRVLDSVEAENAAEQSKWPINNVLKLALSLAAAIVLTISFLQLGSNTAELDTPDSISYAEAQEIFLLEESLPELAALNTGDFNSGELLTVLDVYYLEI